jgi:hypothetical protein
VEAGHRVNLPRDVDVPVESRDCVCAGGGLRLYGSPKWPALSGLRAREPPEIRLSRGKQVHSGRAVCLLRECSVVRKLNSWRIKVQKERISDKQ